jgi:hypothetical protein
MQLQGRQTQFYIDLLYGLGFAAGFGYLLLVGMDARVAAFQSGLVFGYFLRVWEKMSVYERILHEEVAAEAEEAVAAEAEVAVAAEAEEAVAEEVEEAVAAEAERAVAEEAEAALTEDTTMEVEKQMPEDMQQQFDDDLDDHGSKEMAKRQEGKK